MEKAQLPEKNKKKLLLAGVIILLLLTGLIAAIALQPKTSETQSNPSNPSVSSPVKQPISVNYEVNTAAIPAPAADDFTAAVFSPQKNAEYKFLTAGQQKELESSSMVKSNFAPALEQTYAITWKDTGIAGKIPVLPQSVPVYFIARPSDRSVFSVLKDTAAALNIKGSVIRSDTQNYTVGDIATGNYTLFFDLYHLTVNAKNLSIPAQGSADSVKNILTKAGLLGFPSNIIKNQDPRTSAVWYRFTPQLSLPVVSLDRANESVFVPGKAGAVDAAVDAKGNVTEISKSMPNIVEKGNITLASSAYIAARITSGSFLKGNMELQYPGAATLEDKRNFFFLQNQSQIAISNAEVSKVDCGYFVETEPTVQALLAPVCIVNGQGMSGSFPVLFRAAVPAVK